MFRGLAEQNGYRQWDRYVPGLPIGNDNALSSRFQNVFTQNQWYGLFRREQAQFGPTISALPYSRAQAPAIPTEYVSPYFDTTDW
jgi:hypothetical protein